MAEMDKQYEASYHELEEKENWWFKARQDLVSRYLLSSFDSRASILDIGCGGGGLLSFLNKKDFSDTAGVDISPEAVLFCKHRQLKNIFCADAEKQLPFADHSFDIAIASDVLEHLSRPDRALREWKRVLKPGGQLLLFVPAFPFLWSKHDQVNNHVQRFTKRSLFHLTQKAGLTVVQQSYWNSLFFFPHALFLKLRWSAPFNVAHDSRSDQNRLVNTLLKKVLLYENRMIMKNKKLPIGVNIFATFKK